MCTMKAADTSRLRLPEIRYMRKTVDYTWAVFKSRAEIAAELKNASFSQKELTE